jgi:hypothetical protein
MLQLNMRKRNWLLRTQHWIQRLVGLLILQRFKLEESERKKQTEHGATKKPLS